jgi:hypothetical protein
MLDAEQPVVAGPADQSVRVHAARQMIRPGSAHHAIRLTCWARETGIGPFGPLSRDFDGNETSALGLKVPRACVDARGTGSIGGGTNEEPP